MTAPPMPDHEPPPDDPTFLDELRAALLDTDGLDAIPEVEWLVDDVIARDSLAWIGGKPGHGKSFLALDMTGCVGTGYSWHGHIVKQGEVLYVVAEGATGVKQRVRAWEDHTKLRMRNVRWLPMPVQAGLDWQWNGLIELAAEIKPALIVIDTQARVTVGMEENAAKDMGMFVEALERLRKASGACVLVVHHQGRNGEHMRGSTALDGAATTILLIAKEEEVVSVSCEKQKDAEPFDTLDLALVPHEFSAVLKDLVGEQAGKVANTAATKMGRKWHDLFGSDWVSATKLLDAEVASSKATFYRNLAELIHSGAVEKDGESANYTLYRYVPSTDQQQSESQSQSGPVHPVHPYRGGGPDRTTATEPDLTGPTENPQVREHEGKPDQTGPTGPDQDWSGGGTGPTQNGTDPTETDTDDFMDYGPCIRCQELTKRYGSGGNPMCVDCRNVIRGKT